MIAAVAGLPPGAFAAQISLEAVADAELRAGAPDLVVSGDTFVAGALGDFAGNEVRRGLLRFDLTPLPSNAVIREVQLTLEIVRVPQNPGVANFELRRLLRSWNEPEASWNHPVVGKDWQVPGALGDADIAFSATAGLPGLGTLTFSGSAELVSEVQGWLKEPESNHGWLLRSQGESMLRTARHFASREHPNLAMRPRLTIGFVQPPVLEAVTLESGELGFQFAAKAGEVYRVERNSSPGDGLWEELQVVGPLDEDENIFVRARVEPGVAGRFFRVVVD